MCMYVCIMHAYVHTYVMYCTVSRGAYFAKVTNLYIKGVTNFKKRTKSGMAKKKQGIKAPISECGQDL